MTPPTPKLTAEALTVLRNANTLAEVRDITAWARDRGLLRGRGCEVTAALEDARRRAAQRVRPAGGRRVA